MKKLILIIAIILGISSYAAEPIVILRTEKFGRSIAELIDCGGLRYKFYLPTIGTIKCITATGWYIIDSTGKIISYEDSKK